MPIFIRNVS